MNRKDRVLMAVFVATIVAGATILAGVKFGVTMSWAHDAPIALEYLVAGGLGFLVFFLVFVLSNR